MGSQPPTTRTGGGKGKEVAGNAVNQTTARLIDRLHNESDIIKKRKEDLRKKLLEEKEKEMTMIPKINRKSEVLYMQKVVSKRLLTLEDHANEANT